MIPVLQISSRLLVFLFLLCLPSGCLFQKKVEPEPLSPAPAIDTGLIEQQKERIETLEKENSKLNFRLEQQRQIQTSLQLSLLEKHSEIGKCMHNNQTLLADLVNSKAGTRGKSNKLEAVTLIAETTAYADTINELPLTYTQQLMSEKAKKHMEDATREFDKQNYAGAVYLCARALEHLRYIENAQSNYDHKGESIEITFFSPLKMTLLKNANLRNTPSIQGDVLTIIQKGQTVNATGYRGVWVKVTKNADNGWLHHSLLQ